MKCLSHDCTLRLALSISLFHKYNNIIVKFEKFIKKGKMEVEEKNKMKNVENKD